MKRETAPIPNEVFSIEEAAAYMKVGKGEISRLIDAHELPYVPVGPTGSVRRVLKDDCLAYLQRQRVPSKHDLPAQSTARQRERLTA